MTNRFALLPLLLLAACSSDSTDRSSTGSNSEDSGSGIAEGSSDTGFPEDTGAVEDTGTSEDATADTTADTVPGSASSACAVFVDHCVRCHDGILVSPDLRPGTQASLEGASSGYPGNILVVAGDPDASFLFRKMAGTQGGSEGTAMPPTERVAGTELEVVRGWIAAGAADDCDGTERAP